MRRGNDHPNPNKGMTKEALIRAIKETGLGRYVAQFGRREWISEAVAEALQQEGL